jgi:hypothetical protein
MRIIEEIWLSILILLISQNENAQVNTGNVGSHNAILLTDQ